MKRETIKSTNGTDAMLIFADFDGTLTVKDSVLPFMFHVFTNTEKSLPVKTIYLFVVLLSFIFFKLGAISKRKLWNIFASLFLKGKTKKQLCKLGEDFFLNWFPTHKRENIVQELVNMTANGAKLFIVTASPDIYVKHISRLLDVEEICATTFRWEKNICSGTIDRLCEGVEKRRYVESKIREIKPGEKLHTIGYADSTSDTAFMEILEVQKWVK